MDRAQFFILYKLFPDARPRYIDTGYNANSFFD